MLSRHPPSSQINLNHIGEPICCPGSHQVVRGASNYLSFERLFIELFTTQYTVSGATTLYYYW